MTQQANVRQASLGWKLFVPSDWEILPVRRVGEVMVGRQRAPKHQNGPHILPYLRVANVLDGQISYSDILSMNFEPSEQKRYFLQQGDILLNEGQSLELVGRSATFDGPDNTYCFQNTLIRFRANDAVTPSFAQYVFKQWLYSGRFQVVANRTTNIAHLGGERFAAMPFPVPPLETQRRIAAFLDRKTAAIDDLIAKKQRLIELLEEKRAALINRVVTKGLNPDAPMKDSGVPWIGDIPAHWGTPKIAHVTNKITNGYVGPTRNIYVEQGVKYIQSLHIKNNKIIFDSHPTQYFVSKEWSLSHQKSILSSGDVLVVQTGDIGQVALVTDCFSGANCHALIILSPVLSRLHGAFLSWVLNSTYGRSSLLSIQTGALHPHLNCGYVRDVHITLPPISEQECIIAHLSIQLDTLNDAAHGTTDSIKTLKEYRQALITAAVTGQIDVGDDSTSDDPEEMVQQQASLF